ncbi:MAG: hypothetical protein WBG73_20455 [Coleofasciculaceae cyanobacterium]
MEDSTSRNVEGAKQQFNENADVVLSPDQSGAEKPCLSAPG